jgi:hypothetical protein
MRRSIVVTIAAAIACISVFGATAARADESVFWTGNGLDSVRQCVNGVDTPYLHWVLTPGGTPVEGTSADLFINDKNMGTMTPVGESGALQLTITVGKKLTIDQLANASVRADITAGSVGENSVLTISDGCLCHVTTSS